MIPSSKNPAIDKFISDITGVNRVATIKEDKCVACTMQCATFRDNLSRKEYSISGLCQRCQDAIYPDFQ